MLTEDVYCLATNLATNCVLTILEDVTRDGQAAAFTIARHTGPQPEVMVWAAISFDSRTPLLLKHFLGQPDLPDLSSIEHVWDMMRRRLHLPGNFDDLTQLLEQIWQEIPLETIRVPYHSMPRRVAACIQNRDGSTPYCARYFVTM
ncbi:transposable element Tc1 transposase [Trichonephila clavipes]|nr:transposable element Tc1 transposase [Trichonephila clavipes]